MTAISIPSRDGNHPRQRGLVPDGERDYRGAEAAHSGIDSTARHARGWLTTTRKLLSAT
jgi:hypothetical protein